MLEQINRTRACHIMTIEDPIEFLYEDKMAFVNQREIGLDVHNFSDAHQIHDAPKTRTWC
jgi:twitching motility protein PilT